MEVQQRKTTLPCTKGQTLLYNLGQPAWAKTCRWQCANVHMYCVSVVHNVHMYCVYVHVPCAHVLCQCACAYVIYNHLKTTSPPTGGGHGGSLNGAFVRPSFKVMDVTGEELPSYQPTRLLSTSIRRRPVDTHKRMGCTE